MVKTHLFSIRFLPLIVLAFLATGLFQPVPIAAQQVEQLEEQEELTKKREILLLQERIRLLYSQGQYEDVVVEAQDLLRKDPGNSTAILMKDLSERRLAEGSTEPPSSAGSLPLSGEVDLESTGYRDYLPDETPTPESTPAPGESRATPAPGATQEATGQQGDETRERQKKSVMEVMYGDTQKREQGKFKLAVYITSLLGLIALVSLAGGGIAWLRAKDYAPSETSATAASVGRAMQIGDMPTNPQTQSGGGVHSPSQQSQQGTAQAGQFEQESPAYNRQEPVHDMVTQPGGHDQEDQEQPQAEAPAEPPKTEEAPAPQEARQPAASGEQEEQVSSIGIDYSGTDDAVFSQSQAEDIAQTQSDPFKQAPAEPVSGEEQQQQDDDDSVKLDLSYEDEEEPKAEADPQATTDQQKYAAGVTPPSTEQEETEIHQGSPPSEGEESGTEETLAVGPAPGDANIEDEKTAIGFGGGEGSEEESEETRVSEGQPAAQQGSEEDKSYTSIMFGAGESEGEDEQEGEEGSESEGAGDEDLTLGSFNREYSDVMLGSGAAETKMDGVAGESEEKGGDEATVQLGASGAAGGEDQTRQLSPEEQKTEEDEGERTVEIEPQAAETQIDHGSESQPKKSMFDRQYDAGKEAMENGDFARAVQCLSVAASLKPGNKDVREMLDDARKKRRGV